jgi:CPA2 family monovalent cation:H+ antiporter-2
VGGSAVVAALAEVLFFLPVGYWVGRSLGWSQMDSIFLGGILCISSTTIIIRAFEELGVKGQKFAGIVFGTLVIEDLVAVLLLVCLSTLALTQQLQGSEVASAVFKFGFFLVIWFLTGIFFNSDLSQKHESVFE